MELINNTVWIVSGEDCEDCFAVFSSKAYAEAHKKSVVEQWEKSIIRDAILPRLNNRKEIEMHAKEYPEVIWVDKDHYDLVKGWASHPKEGSKEYWYYTLMSNAEWDRYYQRYVDSITIKDYVIVQ